MFFYFLGSVAEKFAVNLRKIIAILLTRSRENGETQLGYLTNMTCQAI